MALINDRIEQLLEHFVAFNVTSSHPDGLDRWVARVFDTCLDALVESNTVGSHSVFQLVIQFFGKVVSHATSVLVHTSGVVVQLDLHAVHVDLVSLFCQVLCLCFLHVLPGPIELVLRNFTGFEATSFHSFFFFNRFSPG